MSARHIARPAGLALPAVILAGLLAVIAAQTGVSTTLFMPPIAATAPPTTTIAPRSFAYRAAGEFQRGTTVEDAPLVRVAAPPPLEIMTYEVSVADYAECVAASVCNPAAPRWRTPGTAPVTGVSFDDATAYAAWLSRRTGTTWRLPTVEEWSFAAGTAAHDTALGAAPDTGNPATRWLRAYEQESALAAGSPGRPQPAGTFGRNEYGVADPDGVVWEWTSTCGVRSTLDAAGQVIARLDNCGVRYLEGRHRAAMSRFIRDALGGGCAVGVPPDNLGFRLIREPTWPERIVKALRGLLPVA